MCYTGKHTPCTVAAVGLLLVCTAGADAHTATKHIKHYNAAYIAAAVMPPVLALDADQSDTGRHFGLYIPLGAPHRAQFTAHPMGLLQVLNALRKGLLAVLSSIVPGLKGGQTQPAPRKPQAPGKINRKRVSMSTAAAGSSSPPKAPASKLEEQATAKVQ